MRIILAAAIALTNAAPALPESPAPPALATHAQVDVPQDWGVQQVVVQSRVFAPGTESGWHVHPGVEMAWVISGTVELATAGGVRRLGPGESFTMPRGVAHNGINRTDEPARVAITLLLDKDAPAREPVPPPR